MRLAIFKKITIEWLVFALFMLVIMMSARLWIFFNYTDSLLRSQYKQDIAKLLFNGFRFDIKIAFIVLVLFVAIACVLLVSKKYLERFYHIQRYGLVFFVVLTFVLTICDVFYYKTYDRQFDVFIFGIFDEDTKAVLKTIVSDYPIVTFAIVILFFTFLTAKLFSFIHYYFSKKSMLTTNKAKGALFVFVVICILVIGLRGSFGTFPLRRDDATVSNSATLNKMVANGIFYLQWAIKDYKKSKTFHQVSDEDGMRLFSILLDKPVLSANIDELSVKIPTNSAVEKQKPNVVFSLMEGMGTHLMQLDDKNNRDLLGALREHFEQDYLYNRFVSEGDGTADTLHRLLIRSLSPDISQSKMRNLNFPTNVFAPYKQAGYRIVFITAGNGGWRNLREFTQNLGVDEFIDEHFLKQHYPQSEQESATWGVPDKFMFDYANEILKNAQQPVFIFTLSITNHPPFRLPNSGKKQDFKLSEDEKKRFENFDEDMVEVLNTFRYSNNALGEFISQVKQLGNTIVAATGDHNMRGIGYIDPAEFALGHGVPFYLYLPPQYAQNAKYNKNRFGSHKDIFPTLYVHTLSNQSYIGTGCDLLSQDDNAWCDYGYNNEITIFNNGFIENENHQFYAWKDADRLIANSQPSEILQEDLPIVKKASKYYEFLSWLINKMVTQNSKND